MEINLFEQILEEAGLKYEELNPEEKETYKSKIIQIRDLGVSDISDVMTQLRYAVETQLVDTPDDDEHRDLNCKLKARLKNYMVLEMFILDPKIRRDKMVEQLKNVKKSI
jgi:hypothetical protein